MRMAELALILALSATPTSSWSQSHEFTRLVGQWDQISFEMKDSWGDPVVSWRLDADGEGNWVDAVSASDPSPGNFTLIWRSIDADPERYSALNSILGDLTDLVADLPDCNIRTHREPYGNIGFHRGRTTYEIRYNFGCNDAGYREFNSILRSVNELVGLWGRAGEIINTEAQTR